jgi:hypothetical protein
LLEEGFGGGVVAGFGFEGAEALVEAGAVVGGGVGGGEALGVELGGAGGLVGAHVGVGEVDVAEGALGLEVDDLGEVVDGGGEKRGGGGGFGEVHVAELGVGEPGGGVVGEGVLPDRFGGLVDAGEGEAVGSEEDDEKSAGTISARRMGVAWYCQWSETRL